MSSNTPPSIDFLPDQSPPSVYRLLQSPHLHHRTHRLSIVHANLPNPTHPGFEVAIATIAFAGQTWHAHSPGSHIFGAHTHDLLAAFDPHMGSDSRMATNERGCCQSRCGGIAQVTGRSVWTKMACKMVRVQARDTFGKTNVRTWYRRRPLHSSKSRQSTKKRNSRKCVRPSTP